MQILQSLSYYLGIRWKSNPASQVDPILNRRAWVLLGGDQVAVGNRTLGRKEIQILSGCPAGGSVRLETLPNAIRFVVAHGQYIRQFNIVEIQTASDGYVLYLDFIWFKNAPPGLGAITLLRMADLAKKLGFVRIELLAAGGTGAKGRAWTEGFWGFEFWPRLGFDAPLHYTIRKQLQTHPQLATATMVSEVVLSDLAWWKRHGDGWEMTFELAEGSSSWYTLNQYLASRKGLLL